ncbi:response regulator [Zoogloea sp.]|uniref:response regulator n=1 Tax=Zoogloea sp. TaxID=49181 RepID=UPI0035B00528
MLSETPPLKTVIVEDNPVLLDLLSGMLASIPGVELIGHADSEAAAIDLLRDARPQLAIVDLELRTGTGLNVLNAVFNAPGEFGAPRTVVFSNHAHPVVQNRCLNLGAAAFFDKSFQMDELLEYVQRAAEARAH